MIIRRYIIKETLKTQLAILFILFAIFFSQKLIRILSSAVEGDVPSHLIVPLLILGITDMANLILPLSLFLGILVTFGRFYTDSEMVTMYACGVKKEIIYQAVLLLAIITSLFTITNTVWFGPWSNIQEAQLFENAKMNPSLAGLIAGQFQKMPKDDAVIYIEEVRRNNINNVFIAQTDPSPNQRPFVVIAEKGKILNDSAGNQIIELDNANRYEGSTTLKDFRIDNFDKYQAIIKQKEVDLANEDPNNIVDQLSLQQLRQLRTPQTKAEYYWRISLLLSVPLMAFLVIPLSVSNPRQGRMTFILPAIFLYLVYFLLESSIRSHASKGQLDATFWFNAVNGLYFLLALVLNMWDSIFMRRIRYKFMLQRDLVKRNLAKG